MYQLHRIYCATPWELEEERRAFTGLVGNFNETAAMKRGVLYIPVSLVANFRDKRPMQSVVNENIRSCRHYVQVLDTAPGDGWGVPERNFERDFRLALECSADPSLPMREVVVLLKKPPRPPAGLDGSVRVEGFVNVDEFKQQLSALFSDWLAASL